MTSLTSEGRDLFAYNEADLFEGTTCMVPVGLQKGGEPISLLCKGMLSLEISSCEELQYMLSFSFYGMMKVAYLKRTSKTPKISSPHLYVLTFTIVY